MQKEPRKWDLLLVPLMFALRDTPQALTQFTPFELIFAYRPRSPLQVAREDWERPGHKQVGAQQDRQDIVGCLKQAQQFAQANLERAQQRQKASYDQKA